MNVERDMGDIMEGNQGREMGKITERIQGK